MADLEKKSMNLDEVEIKLNSLESRIKTLEEPVKKEAAEPSKYDKIEVGDKVVLTKPLNNIPARVIETDEGFVSDSAQKESGEEVGIFELDLSEDLTKKENVMSVNRIVADSIEVTDVNLKAWSPVLREDVLIHTIFIPHEYVKKA